MGAYKEVYPKISSSFVSVEMRDQFWYGPYDIRHEQRVTGSITLGCDDASTSYLYFFDGNSATSKYLKWNDSSNWFEFNSHLIITGNFRSYGNVLADGRVFVNYNFKPGENAYLNFNYYNQYLMYDDSDQEFRLGGQSSLVSFNLRGDQVVVGNREVAPSSGYKYLAYTPNADGGVGGAIVGLRYDYTYKVNQFSNDGVVWENITSAGAPNPISASIGVGWTAYDYSLAVGHIYATGVGNANTPLAGQSYIGLNAGLDTNDPEITMACGQSVTPISASIKFDYSESEFVFSEDVRLYNVTENVNKDLYIKDLTLSATNNVNNIYLDNGSFIKSTVDKLHIEAPTVSISNDVETFGSFKAREHLYVNSDYVSGSGVANLYFNDTRRKITHKTDEDMFQLTAERLQLGYGAGSGSGVDTKIEYNINTTEHPALGGVNPYHEFNKLTGLWEVFDVNGLRVVSDISGSVGTVQQVSDQGSITTNSIQLANLYADGNLYANYSGGDGDSYLYFYEDESPTGKYLKWDDSDDRFEFNDSVYITGTVVAAASGSRVHSLQIDDDLQVGGNFIGTLNFTDVNASGVISAATSGSSFKDTRIIGDLNIYDGDVNADQVYSRGDVYINSEGPDGNSYLYFYDGDAPSGEYLKYNNVSSWFELSGALVVGGDVWVAGNVLSNVNMYINYDGGDGDSYLYFYDGGSTTGKYLKWDDGDSRFELNGSVVVTLGDITANTLYSNGNIYVNSDGPEGNSIIYFYEGGSQTGTYLMWNNTDDEFLFGDKVNITGQLQCDSFRIDQTPTGGDPTTDGYIVVNCNGTNYRIPCVED